MASTLEARLQYLETREEANTKDILRLKTENVELRTKVHELNVENSQVKLKLNEMERKFGKLENDLIEVYTFRDGIEDQLNRLESRMQRVKDVEDRMSMLETAINEARQEITSSNQLMTERPNVSDQDGNTSSSEIGEIKNSIKTLENISAHCTQSVVHVLLKPRGRVKTEKFMKLNQCVEVIQNAGTFNMSSCVMIPQTDGDYLLHASYRQEKEGSIFVTVNTGDSKLALLIGQTDDDTCAVSCITRVMPLKKGQKVWLEVNREYGEAYLKQCRFYCRLL